MFERKCQRIGSGARVAGMVAVLIAAASIPAIAAGGGPIFMSPGGDYCGTVGAPIELNAGSCVNGDDGRILGYYWDWFNDGIFESVSLPKSTYTYFSAYSGTLVLQIWDEHDDLGTGECAITVTGPKNILTATLKSSADLHVYGPRCYHTGLSTNSGTLKATLPDSTFTVLDANGEKIAYEDKTPAEGCTQVISWPMYIAGTYQVKAVGTGDGPFELTIRAAQDDVVVAERTVSGTICDGETAVLAVTGSYADGKLSVAFDEPTYSPGLCVEPSEIALVVEAGKTYQVPLTIREAFLRAPLASVSLSNKDISGPVNKVAEGAVSFDPQTFDLEAGGEKQVTATIPIPHAFLGQATGSIVVNSASGASAVVKVTLSTAGKCPPHCNGIAPVKGVVGAAVTFDASNSYDPDGKIIHYSWDWDADGDFEYTDQPVITHTWNAPFAGKVRLLIFDDDDMCADTYVDVTITAP
ncbi:MAG: PKD domain-containing protein [Solirubrobacterales bacterium]